MNLSLRTIYYKLDPDPVQDMNSYMKDIFFTLLLTSVPFFLNVKANLAIMLHLMPDNDLFFFFFLFSDDISEVFSLAQFVYSSVT